MIDKDLSKLKKDLPNYNIDDYKNGIYQKYNNKKNAKKIYFPKLAFVSISLYISFISYLVRPSSDNSFASKNSTAFWYSFASTLIA